jgi:hypothetical protein
MTLPPWRKSQAMLSKWCPARATDQVRGGAGRGGGETVASCGGGDRVQADLQKPTHAPLNAADRMPMQPRAAPGRSPLQAPSHPYTHVPHAQAMCRPTSREAQHAAASISQPGGGQPAREEVPSSPAGGSPKRVSLLSTQLQGTSPSGSPLSPVAGPSSSGHSRIVGFTAAGAARASPAVGPAAAAAAIAAAATAASECGAAPCAVVTTHPPLHTGELTVHRVRLVGGRVI